MKLRSALFFALILSLVLSLMFWWFWDVPAYLDAPPRAKSGKLEITDLYENSGTKVKIVSGNILKSIPGEPVSAFVIGAKLGLEKPHVPTSLDSIVRKKALKHSQAETFTKELESNKELSKKEVAKEYWVASFSPDPIPSGRKLYMLAGVDVDIWNDKRPKDALKRKATIIEKGITEVLIKAAEDGIVRLYVPLIGAGAGGLAPDVSIRAIISGVNEAAVSGRSPKEIVILFYAPGKNQAAENDELSQLSFETFNLLKDISGNGVWKKTSSYLLASQLLLLIFAVTLSAILATFTLKKVVLTPGAVMVNIFKWVAVSSGFLASSQSEPFTFNPLPWGKFSVLFIACLVVPLWEWGKFGEPIEIKNDKPNN